MKKMLTIINKYKTFIKYIFSAGISFFIDITLFTIFLFLLKNTIRDTSLSILVATISARAISSFINYLINKNRVFETSTDKKVDKRTIIKYYILVVIQACASSVLVGLFHSIINIHPTFIKIPVECIIFIVNFFIQKYFIFTDNPVKIVINEKIMSIVFGILSTFTVVMNMSRKSIISQSQKDSNVLLYLIVAIAFTYFYNKFNKKYKSNNVFKSLAVILSVFMVVGYSYDKVGSAYLIFGNIGYMIASLIKLLCYYKIFDICINIVYEYLCEYKITDIVKKSEIVELFDKHPFITTSVFIFICYIPYIVAFYPAVMGYDPSNQIREFMGMHTRYMDSVILLDPNMTITNFNPVLHTLLLGGCFKLGHVIGNDNIGLFIYVIIQCIIVISTFAYSIVYMKKEGVCNKLLFIVILMYALIPVFPFYSITTNKDTIFCCFVLLYCIKLYDVIKHKQSIKKYISFFIIMLFVTLTRNNGVYTIVLSLPFALIWLKDKRKPILITLCAVLVCYTGYNKIILPAFKISNTSIREMLSVPFQQTARLAKYHPNAFSDKDKEIIDKILEFDTLAERYDPRISDPVKNKYNIYTTNDDLKKYFGVWFKGLTKYPDVYIDSTINNIYGYFYPDTSRWYLYYEYNTKLQEAGFDYHYNGLKTSRSVLSEIGLIYPYIPIIGLFVNIGFVGWIYFFLFAAFIVKKEYKYIPFVLPALSFILVCIAGPANTYFRYAFPYIMPLPLTICLLYYVFQNNNIIDKKKSRKKKMEK